MAKEKFNSPLLGYNTNIRHAGHIFHIQTEDSGRDHPHVITHLFTEGTILSTKKTAYKEHLDAADFEEIVRRLMKDQHKAMFVELREGAHDQIAEQILGHPLDYTASSGMEGPKGREKTGGFKVQGAEDGPPPGEEHRSSVAAMAPAKMERVHNITIAESSISRGVSIFESPDPNGSFGDSFISDKSLDEVIMNYLMDELDE